MITATNHLRIVVAALTILIMAACNTVTVEKYRAVPESQVDSAFIKPGTDFGVYSRLMAAPMEIYYPNGAEPPTAAELAQIRSIFRRNFLTAIGDDYPIVDQPGPDVLRVRASLVDMKTRQAPAGAQQVGGRLGPLLDAGRLTFLMELIDSQSNEVLARAADEEKRAPADESGDTWSQIDAAAHGWALAFRKFLDGNLARR